MIQQAQVDEIMTFCEAKGVTYYDIQVELVDHIADSIEELQKSNPALPFSDALDLAGKQFGNEEFAAIVKSKKRLIEKRMSRLIEKEFLSFFTIPRMLITIFLFGIILAFPYLEAKYTWIPLSVAIPASIIYWVYYWPYEKEIMAIKKACRIPILSLIVQSRYDLFLKIIQTILILLPLLNLSLKEIDIKKLPSNSPEKVFLMQLLGSGLIILILLFIASLYVRRRVYRKIFDQYTKAFISE
jgi:hypothetical protein